MTNDKCYADRFWLRQKALDITVDPRVLDSQQFKEQWNQYRKDMLGTCQPNYVELKTLADISHLRITIHASNDSNCEDSTIQMKYVPDEAENAPWLHMFLLNDISNGKTKYLIANIPHDFEPNMPPDWGEMLPPCKFNARTMNTTI